MKFFKTKKNKDLVKSDGVAKRKFQGFSSICVDKFNNGFTETNLFEELRRKSFYSCLLDANTYDTNVLHHLNLEGVVGVKDGFEIAINGTFSINSQLLNNFYKFMDRAVLYFRGNPVFCREILATSAFIVEQGTVLINENSFQGEFAGENGDNLYYEINLNNEKAYIQKAVFNKESGIAERREWTCELTNDNVLRVYFERLKKYIDNTMLGVRDDILRTEGLKSTYFIDENGICFKRKEEIEKKELFKSATTGIEFFREDTPFSNYIEKQEVQAIDDKFALTYEERNYDFDKKHDYKGYNLGIIADLDTGTIDVAGMCVYVEPDDAEKIIAGDKKTIKSYTQRCANCNSGFSISI